jgi:hypothetical protein
MSAYKDIYDVIVVGGGHDFRKTGASLVLDSNECDCQRKDSFGESVEIGVVGIETGFPNISDLSYSLVFFHTGLCSIFTSLISSSKNGRSGRAR